MKIVATVLGSYVPASKVVSCRLEIRMPKHWMACNNCGWVDSRYFELRNTISRPNLARNGCDGSVQRFIHQVPSVGPLQSLPRDFEI